MTLPNTAVIQYTIAFSMTLPEWYLDMLIAFNDNKR